MTSEAPRRRASDQDLISSPRAVRPTTTSEPSPTEKNPEATAGQTPEPGFSNLGSGRANASRERRHRDMEWQGPERRISDRF